MTVLGDRYVASIASNGISSRAGAFPPPNVSQSGEVEMLPFGYPPDLRQGDNA